MKNKKVIFLSMGLIVLALAVVGCAPNVTGDSVRAPIIGDQSVGMFFSQQQVGLWVNGEGKAMAVPDVAILSLGIESEAMTVAQAQNAAAEAMNNVMKALTGNGVQEKDIQTTQFSVYPVRRWVEEEKREEIIGYRVTNMVIAKIREISKAGTIIDAVTIAGGDLTRVNDISFTVDDPKPYYGEAREKAVQDAVAKAKQIAQAAGIKLGKPLYISEVNVYVPQPMSFKGYAESNAPVPPTPISPGELEITLTVQVVYEID